MSILIVDDSNTDREIIKDILAEAGYADLLTAPSAAEAFSFLNLQDDTDAPPTEIELILMDIFMPGMDGLEACSHIKEAEQKRGGEKLGKVLVRLGLLTARQLDAVLNFQRTQSDEKRSHSPLRLGELLISKGYISREQLGDALYKQTFSNKKLGEVLIEEGYAKPHHIKHGIRLQHMLLSAALAALLTACGSAGDNLGTQGGDINPIESAGYSEQINTNSFTVTSDDYDVLTPNFYYSTNNTVFWSIQAAIANDLYDPEFKCVVRIDILKENGAMPVINKTFSIEDNAQYEKFPGNFFVFNGQESTDKKVEQGIISFTSESTASGDVDGYFDVTLTDYDSATIPAPQYRLKGIFSFKMGTYGPAISSPDIASNTM